MEIWDHSYRWLDAPAGRTILVGDLHGCYSELLTLLERLDFSPRDLLLAVGDLLDRGPESWELARFFRETPNAHSVLGNHERKVVKVMQGAVEPAWSQTQTLSRLPEDQWPRWSEWLCSLPLIIETPDVVVAHARIDPERSLREQETRHVTGVGGPGLKIARDCDDVPTHRALWRLAGFGTPARCVQSNAEGGLTAGTGGPGRQSRRHPRSGGSALLDS